MLFWAVYMKKDIEVNRISKFIYDHTSLGVVGAFIIWFFGLFISINIFGLVGAPLWLIGGTGTLYFILMGSVKGCPRCHKFFGRIRLSREILGTSHHTQTSHRMVRHYDNHGNVMGSSSIPVSELKTEHHVRNEWECKKCGYELHSDLNASKNIVNLGISEFNRLYVNQPIVASHESYKPTNSLVR